jgi:hypothetical protein
MTDVSNITGWLAIFYIIVKDLIIPVFRKTIPAKTKQENEQLRHDLLMEEKRLDAELGYQKRIAEAVESIKTYMGSMNERLSLIESDMKEVKSDLHAKQRTPRKVKG